MEKYRNTYRIPSARLRHWDYGSEAIYFITICAHNRVRYFGNVVDTDDAAAVETRCIASLRHPISSAADESYRTAAAAVETRCIASLPPPTNVETRCIASLPHPPPKRIMQLSEIGTIVESEWVKTFELRKDMNISMGEFVVMPNHFHAIIAIGENQYNNPHRRRDAMHRVCSTTNERRDAMHRVSTANDAHNAFGPQSKNLASIIRGFKSAVTIAARTIAPAFRWQARFHDHIIRNDDSLQRITEYIRRNPERWDTDTFFSQEQP